MCGICGVVYNDPDLPVDEAMLRRMTDIVRHRGPDSDGFHVAPGIGLGFRRLSIIDLETGDQPISNEDQTVTVICNGEIYNYKELRQQLLSKGHHFRTRSDVEVIVHLYEDYGVECLHHLRGMFGFALWDARRRVLMLARDRLGIKPLHYAFSKDGLYFGSEQKSILIADQIERQIDFSSLYDLFSVGFITAPKTLFSEIRRLLPGHYLVFDQGRHTIHRYWRMDFQSGERGNKHIKADEWAESLREKLDEAVRIHLRSDVEVGAWLSPGIDSSGIVSLMRQHVNLPIQTFTLAFENPALDEVRTHKTLDRYAGYEVPNHQVVVKNEHFRLFPKALWHCEDPFTTGVEVCRMVLSEAASSAVKVVLTGEGADEMLGGYPRYWSSRVLERLSGLPLPLRQLIVRWPAVRKRWPGGSRLLLASPEMDLKRFAMYVGPAAQTSEFHNQLFSSDLKQALASTAKPLWEEATPEGFSNLPSFVQMLYYDTTVRLPDAVVHHLDRASMAYSLEARVPYLDDKLVEFCVRTPRRMKMRGLQEKHILRKALRADLPPDIASRRKRGLSAPFQQWLREPLPDFAVDLLSEARLREKGYFNPAFVASLLEQHRAGCAKYGRQLLGILGVQIWDDMFLHGCRPNVP